MKKLLNSNNIYLTLLFGFATLVFLVNIRINLFRYNNFDMGKFDLGNMTQMVWNVSEGRGLVLTDYFGTNLPRWAMSHVDPILYVFVPIFMLVPHPLTLVFSQIALVLYSCFLVYFIAKLKLKSNLSAFLIGCAYLLYPALGYLTAWTGFHGVTAVIPFFFLSFYIFEKMYINNSFSKRGLILFWISIILFMMGKEQLSLYVVMFGLFVTLFRKSQKKLGYLMMFLGSFWFALAFFVIIPMNAHYRVEGYEKFVKSINIEGKDARNVALPNYFLSRYDEFGDSYGEIVLGMLSNPSKSVLVFFGGDRPENFDKTMRPLLYLPFAYPIISAISLPDFVINYMTTAGGIGTSEISNHRISAIIPVLFISLIYSISYLNDLFKKLNFQTNFIGILLCVLVLISSIVTTFEFNNPVFLWLEQTVKKRVAFAKFDRQALTIIKNPGDVIKLNELEDKDRECAEKIVSVIPDDVSVSGPDSLGTHLAQRETYAIFPALYNEADYVIVDVFARKILTILDIDNEFLKDIITDILKDEDYELKFGCGNYFIFKRVGQHEKETLLPFQERREYKEKYNWEIFQQVKLVDFSYPTNVKINVHNRLRLVYFRYGNGADKKSTLEEYLMFTTLLNSKTGEVYQQANLPSFAIKRPEEWEEDRYYIEDIEFVIPEFVEEGNYKIFVGMGNKVRTRSIYLGDVEVEK